jgi:hypothetical protein
MNHGLGYCRDLKRFSAGCQAVTKSGLRKSGGLGMARYPSDYFDIDDQQQFWYLDEE